ncbi:hypothetical protein Nepgr_014322 [Nepenthes gracilis]|uniref:Uncharacterized protein n=1 Tax=Nepenthes gracilis TaxID=150966 RepID=A0AAD3XQ67_NEPGR|nr:hypothetical protein Nepgr_014322 [Nepenthes gracilis]
MLDNPSDHLTPKSPPVPVKRYAPPNQRNRSLNRRKSGDRFERTSNLHGNDGDKNLATAFKGITTLDHGEAGSTSYLNDSLHTGFIALNGCHRSEASQLLHDRWEAAIHCYNDPSIDLSERPVMYSGSPASAWGNFRLPHQMDFLAELQRAMHGYNATISKT